jgi:hypothetical protein
MINSHDKAEIVLPCLSLPDSFWQPMALQMRELACRTMGTRNKCGNYKTGRAQLSATGKKIMTTLDDSWFPSFDGMTVEGELGQILFT